MISSLPPPPPILGIIVRMAGPQAWPTFAQTNKLTASLAKSAAEQYILCQSRRNIFDYDIIRLHKFIPTVDTIIKKFNIDTGDAADSLKIRRVLREMVKRWCQSTSIINDNKRMIEYSRMDAYDSGRMYSAAAGYRRLMQYFLRQDAEYALIVADEIICALQTENAYSAISDAKLRYIFLDNNRATKPIKWEDERWDLILHKKLDLGGYFGRRQIKAAESAVSMMRNYAAASAKNYTKPGYRRRMDTAKYLADYPAINEFVLIVLCVIEFGNRDSRPAVDDIADWITKTNIRYSASQILVADFIAKHNLLAN